MKKTIKVLVLIFVSITTWIAISYMKAVHVEKELSKMSFKESVAFVCSNGYERKSKMNYGSSEPIDFCEGIHLTKNSDARNVIYLETFRVANYSRRISLNFQKGTKKVVEIDHLEGFEWI